MGPCSPAEPHPSPTMIGWQARSTRRRDAREVSLMTTYRMVNGDDEEVVRETYDDITSVERADGWLVLFRGNDAILRGQEEHAQEFGHIPEEGRGLLAQRSRTVGACRDSGYCHELR